MPFFDAPRWPYPRRWSKQSLDYKLFFVWMATLFGLIVFSGSGLFANIPPALYGGGLAIYLLVLLSVSLVNRRRKGWRRPSLSSGDWLKAGLAAAAMGLFFFVFTRPLLPISPTTAPMLLFAASIVVFNMLIALRLAQFSESEFQAICAGMLDGSKRDAAPREPNWKGRVRGIYGVLFILVWLESMAFFYFHQRFMHDGSLKPTPAQSESIVEHGTRIYLTHGQASADRVLMTAMMIGIPSILLSGFLLHFVAGIPMFRNLPASRGLFGRGSSEP